MRGLSATRRSPEIPTFALAFACVMHLIVDLDRAHEGLLRINQPAMISSNESMQTSRRQSHLQI